MNHLIEKRQRGEATFGTFSQFKNAVAVESLGYTGLDYVILDSEHSCMDTEMIYTYITAADAGGITPIVRIPEVSRREVLRVLDAGAKGMIIPGIRTVDEVKRLVEYAKFAPVGRRGYAPTRDGRWGQDEISQQGVVAYMEHANRDTLLMPQCETLDCLEHIEEIAAIEGVDGIFVGPLDLSIAMGCPTTYKEDPRFKAAIERILAACKANNKMTVIYAWDAKDAIEKVAMGFDSVTIGLDILAMIQGYQQMVADLRKYQQEQ